MTRVMRHRGPDYQGTWTDKEGSVALAFDRLSIVDLSSEANQPLANEDHTVFVVCNGEIYNHRELRDELEKGGHTFRSRSDCEVLVHLYEEHGEALLDRLRGMFAFVLYDSVRRRVLVARDRAGKKPLVFAETSEFIAFASEIPALLHLPGIDLRPDPEALGLYLLRNLRHIPDPWTIYRGIRRVPPGHAMLIESGRVVKRWRYWRPRLSKRMMYDKELRETFDEAVDVRRVADVEVAALLSGGVDSTSIVHSMVAQGNRRVRTFAMGRDAADDELVRARAAARFLGTEHAEFYFHPERQHDQLEDILRGYGEPIMLVPLMLTYELCQQIRDRGIRVVMAGHGADELFFGYSGHLDQARLTRILRWFPAMLRPVARIAARLVAAGSRRRDGLLAAGAPPGKRKAAIYEDEARRLWSTLFVNPPATSHRRDIMERWLGPWLQERPSDYIDEANLVGLMTENAHSVTVAGDLPAMLASVEVRCPFLDQKVVELAWQMSYETKLRATPGTWAQKAFLKKVMAGRLPKEIILAPKRGFGFNIQEEQLFRGPWKKGLDEIFDSADDLDGILDLAAVKALKRRFDDGDSALTALVAKLYALFLFRAKFWPSSATSPNLQAGG